jgi:heat shock protein HtpX
MLVDGGLPREYEADARARAYHRASGLEHALAKLDATSRQVPLNATPATAHPFIINPLTSGGLATLFSTHPPIEERIARLRAMRL